MSRRIWHAVTFLFGAVFLAFAGFQSYQFYQAAEQQRAQYKYQPARTPGFRIAVPSKTPTPHYKPSCNNPKDDKDADLCAQWAAVDQVSEANRLATLNVRLATLTFLLSAIGTIALLWTLRETRIVSRAELRAYVSSRPLKFTINPVSKKIGSEVTTTNDGNTPAYAVGTGGNIWICSLEHAATELAVPEKPEGIRRDVVLHKGQNWKAAIESEPIFTTENEAALRSGAKFLFSFGSTYYTDAFGDEHASHFCYCLENYGEAVPIWTVTPFHNTAD